VSASDTQTPCCY